jgi:hypothetical protein
MEGSFFKELLFKVTADTKGATLGIANLEKELEKLNVSVIKSQTAMQKFTAVSSTVGKVSGLMLSGFVGLAFAAEHFSKQMEIANAQVANTFTQMGYNAQQLMPFVERLETTFTNLTFTASDTAQAYSNLVTGLRSPTEAMRLMGTVADFAAKTHMTLTEAATATVKAAQGQSRAFKQVGVTFNDGATNAEKFANGMKKVAENTKGAAEALAKTASGSLEVMKAKSEAAMATLGNALAPVLVMIAGLITAFVVPALNSISKAFTSNIEGTKKLIDVLLLLFVGSKIITGIVAFVKVWKTVQEVYYGVKVAALSAGAATAFLEGLTGVGLAAIAASTAAVAGALTIINNQIDKVGKGFQSSKDTAGDYAKIVADIMKAVGNKPIDFGTSKSSGTKPTLASDWNQAAKDIQVSVKKILTNLQDLSKLSVAKSVSDLAIDPLTKALNSAKDASVEYSKAQTDLIAKTRTAVIAEKAYVASMNDVTDAGTARTQALKNAVDIAKQTAIDSATTADNALQDIMSAQKAYADEVINRVSAMRSAFQNATQIDLGGIAGNISTAKKNLADAQKALLDEQNKFKSNVSSQAYAGVVTNATMPVFQAQIDAVNKAQDDLAIALGSKQNPFLATVDELQTALKNSYDNAVSLSVTAGNLSAAGFSQEFINQVISAGPVLGVQLGKAILDSAPMAQSSMSKMFNDITNISKTGVNALSITMNQDAINVMDKFIKNFGSMNIDPIKKLTDSITALVESMATNIANAVKAATTAISQIGTISSTPTLDYGGNVLGSAVPNFTPSTQYPTPSGTQVGPQITVNATTNANPQQIAQEVAWTIVNSSDANYSSIYTQQGLINKIKANPKMMAGL